MSVKVMGLCFDARFKSHTRKAVAVALADHASEEGERVFPSIARLADKTELSDRTVQRAVRDLEALGVIIVVSKGGAGEGDTREWRFDMPLLRNLADGNVEILDGEGDSATPSGRLRVSPVHGRVTLATIKGDTVSPEPSLTVKESSRAGARASEGARSAPAAKRHPKERVVLWSDPEWAQWFALYKQLHGEQFVKAFGSEEAMIVYADKPHKSADPPGLLVPNGVTFNRLMAERAAKEEAANKNLTARSRAMSGEAA